ncbi:sugar ABC transporter ATP-binding protein [Mesorhizobium sp. M0006]|uniref:sugar ABC transporter ATP-binding protein n=1 Tax=Mesorhizobium sp. M0006 TaxID=2956838 RepID=UPI00333B9F41
MTDQIVTVRVKSVSKSFGETRALRSVDFEARAGEVHAIVGENGSGKSTLAKIMSGVLLADLGDVKILGRAPRTPIQARDAGLATIFQEILVADGASVFDNLYVGRDRLFRATARHADRVAEAQDLMDRFVGAPVDLQATVDQLPLNIRQWIVIARAILCRPKVLILDESSAALDLDATVRLHAEISRLRTEGATILIVTHRIAELVRIADRATVLRDGEAVGVLEKESITEENLVTMMTASNRHAGHAETVTRLKREAAAAPVVSVKGIELSKGTAPINFFVDAGQIVGVTGLDGHGQDDFLRSLAGIRPPQAGVPCIIGQDDSEHPLASLGDAEQLGVAYVSGDRKREGIFPDQSIYENLAIGIYRQNLGPFGVIRRSGLAQSFDREVKRLRIKTGPPSNKITSLSGGNQQKILIGRAFARKPRVIILNDPARGVDIGTKRDLYVELRRFADEGGAVVYLSSEIEEFVGFADRVDVFVDHTIFRSLSGTAIAEDDMLAAMFGQARDAHVSFEIEEAAQ